MPSEDPNRDRREDRHLTGQEHEELAEVDARAEHFRLFGTYDGFDGIEHPDDSRSADGGAKPGSA